MKSGKQNEVEVVEVGGEQYLLVSWPLAPEGPHHVTPSERAILHALSDGKSNAEIARIRGTSARTVANQVAALLRKFGVSSRLELVAASERSSDPRRP